MDHEKINIEQSGRTGRTVKIGNVLLWILIVFAPVIAGWIIGLVSGTDPLRLDAWNTTWNDENGYFRVIRTMRHYGVPQGMTGFNEIISGNDQVV